MGAISLIPTVRITTKVLYTKILAGKELRLMLMICDSTLYVYNNLSFFFHNKLKYV